jgi:hypothetical protein
MAAADLQQIFQLLGRLTADERSRLRAAIDISPPQTPEDELDLRLLQSGLISSIPRRPADRNPNPEPIRIEGKPLSETVIEERR